MPFIGADPDPAIGPVLIAVSGWSSCLSLWLACAHAVGAVMVWWLADILSGDAFFMLKLKCDGYFSF